MEPVACRRLSTPMVSTHVGAVAAGIAGERPGELVRLVHREPVGLLMDVRLVSRRRTFPVLAGCRTSTQVGGAWADRRSAEVVEGTVVRKEYGFYQETVLAVDTLVTAPARSTATG